MENDRPVLDMKLFGAICPDKNGMCSIVGMNWAQYVV